MSDTMSDAGTSVIEDTQTTERELYEEGDEERFAHYVPKEEIARAAVEGTPARALCGKKWVPTRDPEKFPVCPDCQRIYDQLKES